MDLAEARQRAAEHLRSTIGDNVALLDAETLDTDVGWVFFYESVDYLRSGDFRDALAGNAPIVVDKASGQLHVTGTAEPLEVYLDRLRHERAADS
jgi:immunity protein 35 of polymorphic toxin system